MAAQAQGHGAHLLCEKSRQLTGRVKIEDAYLGGEVQGGKAG